MYQIYCINSVLTIILFVTQFRQACNEFPFLKDQNSWGYILAKARVEEACKNLQIRTSLHELEEMEVLRDAENPAQYKQLLQAFAFMDRRIPESG